ncbi:MAG: chemotaxis protein CheB, partial [Bdellovibrionia bacterium]
MRSEKKSQSNLKSTSGKPKKSTSRNSKTATKKNFRDKKFQIVGIGASAGGLEALKGFLSHLDPKVGMAYVVVQHLDPKHGSLSAEILSRSTSMLVSEIHDGDLVHSNRVYVMPPNCDLSIKSGKLKIQPSTKTRRQHMCIDTFFTSLAEEKKQSAVGIILSGTATDGTQGCLAIKARGGVTFAQDPSTAQYAGMPQAAISAGAIDFVHSPEGIAEKISNIDSLSPPSVHK